MKPTEQAGTGTVRGRHVGLYLEPDDYERLKRWAKRNRRSLSNSAETIILERVTADELAEQRAELATGNEQ